MRHAHVDTSAPVSRIGLGTWQFGAREWGYGPDYDDREAAAIVRRALELGVTLFDTAEIYGMGRSERILGKALRDAGADPGGIFLASKVFPVLPTAPVVQQRAVASARRLGVPRLDLYQVHQPNPVVRDATTMRGMHALLQLGLVGHAGVSNYSLRRWQEADAALAQAHRDSPEGLGADPGATPVVLSNQVQYSLVHRGPETELLPFAQRERRLVIAYSPLAQGLLSARRTSADAVTGVRAGNPLFLPDNLDSVQPLFATLREVADAHRTDDATPAQVALAWVIRNPQVAAIPGASSVAQLESNVAAAELDLRDDEVAALTAAAEAFRPVKGWRAAPRVARSLAAARRR